MLSRLSNLASCDVEVYGYKVPVWSVAASCTGAAAMYAGYRWLTAGFDTFKRMGVPGPPPGIIFGPLYQMTRQGFPQAILEWRRKYGDVIGYHIGCDPIICFFDPEIVKIIAIKEFSSFINRNVILIGDSVLDQMMTSLVDDQWKHVRSLVSPTFSSGKLRMMSSQINRAARTMADNMRTAGSRATGGAIVEIKEQAGAFSMDVIASTAFSVDIDSKNNPNSDFVRHAKAVFDVQKRMVLMAIMMMYPKLIPIMTNVGIHLFPPESTAFFSSTVNQALDAARRSGEGNQRAKDFMQLMVEAEIDDPEVESELKQGDGQQKGLTHDEVLSQGVIFFLAGYETTANAMGFLLYNLAVYPDAQESIYKEIGDQLGDEEPNYDLVGKLKYLGQCLDETMRMYPGAPVVDRVCKNDITVGGHLIPAGMLVHIPVHALHHDPDIYPEPTEFRPERFTPEAKASRNPMSYIPFGAGPRMCVASRLALFEIKMAVVHLLRNFRFTRCDETEVPLKLSMVGDCAANGIRLMIEPRD